MSIPSQNCWPSVDGQTVLVSGWFPRIARLQAEYHEFPDDPASMAASLRHLGTADIFTFVQPVSDLSPRHSYHLEWDDLAVLHFDSHESWWKTQLNDKTRNMIRKAGKKGVEIRASSCDDEFVRGIKKIYDESPIRQGKRFPHFGKDLDTLRQAHLTFSERSEFIGAYFDGELIGFIKMIYHEHSASVMQIISALAHRDKAPTNALLAKAVEICAAKGILFIQYGVWSRRSLGDFKKHNRFEHVRVPRYYVPLNFRGRLALRLRLHRDLSALVPESVLDLLANLRGRWYAHKVATAAG